MVARFILDTTNLGPYPVGRIDSGANYEGCSRATPELCQPVQFSTLDDAFAYADAHGESAVMVQSADEAWGMIEGSIPIPSSLLSNPFVLGVGAFVLFRLFKKK